MPQSLSKVNVHLVFSTKHGQFMVNNPVRKELHAYLIDVLAKLGSYTYEIYANPDHIHILNTLPRTITIATLVSKIKTSSSKWLKLPGIHGFDWQDGYAIFSVSASKIETVRSYILSQPEHHRIISFQDELRKFFKEYKIDFDERYVWD
jgi:putative transposase